MHDIRLPDDPAKRTKAFTDYLELYKDILSRDELQKLTNSPVQVAPETSDPNNRHREYVANTLFKRLVKGILQWDVIQADCKRRLGV